MTKPIIGIVGSLYKESRESFLGNYFDFNNNNYSQCIARANGIPIYLPIIKNEDIIEKQLSICKRGKHNHEKNDHSRRKPTFGRSYHRRSQEQYRGVDSGGNSGRYACSV